MNDYETIKLILANVRDALEHCTVLADEVFTGFEACDKAYKHDWMAIRDSARRIEDLLEAIKRDKAEREAKKSRMVRR